MFYRMVMNILAVLITFVFVVWLIFFIGGM